MKPSFLRLIFGLWCVLLCGSGAWAQQSPLTYAQARVITPQGAVIEVEVADTDEKRGLGLGERAQLKVGQGMLFVFETHASHPFWMKGMNFPIDILWLDNYRIVHIEANVSAPKPGQKDEDLKVLQSYRLANFVLELPAGQAKALGLEVGQQLKYQFE